MSAAKATPGPWIAKLSAKALVDGIQISGPDGQQIAYVQPDHTEETDEGLIVEVCTRQQKANARLVVTAPELLTEHERDLLALLRIEKELEQGRFFPGSPAYCDLKDMLSAKRKIIAKARGE